MLYFSDKFKRIKTIYKTLAKHNKWRWRPVLFPSSNTSINAYYNIWYIVVYQGAMDCYNDDEMALLLGHEMSHYLLHHMTNCPQNEFDADELGAKIMIKAGYDICNAIGKFDRMFQVASRTHPHPQKRKERIKQLFNCE
jgi:Zn-dependent protease with chaperone function